MSKNGGSESPIFLPMQNTNTHECCAGATDSRIDLNVMEGVLSGFEARSDLQGYAARDALRALMQNWRMQDDGGKVKLEYLEDIDAVCELLQKAKNEMLGLPAPTFRPAYHLSIGFADESVVAFARTLNSFRTYIVEINGRVFKCLGVESDANGKDVIRLQPVDPESCEHVGEPESILIEGTWGEDFDPRKNVTNVYLY